MRAYVRHSYGSPDVLHLLEIDKPVPGDDEVLVRVHATSINPYDWHHMRGEPRVARLMPGGMGVRRPDFEVLGTDVAGEVEAVGAAVTTLRPGDQVYGQLHHGGFAEFAAAPEHRWAPKPDNLSYEEAAAVPMAASS